MGPAVMAGLLAAVLGQEAPTGEVKGRGTARVSDTMGRGIHPAYWDPHPEWLEAVEAGRRLHF